MKVINYLVILTILNISGLVQAMDKTAFSGKDFWYIDQVDRVEIITDLYKQTKSEYALWTHKKKRMGIDGDKLFTDAINTELSIEDTKDSLSQARANMEFYDRAKKLIAGFKDTHFGLRTHISAPWIVSGFNTKYVVDSEKIIIASKYNKVIQKSMIETENTDMALIELGDELLTVDGVKAQDLLKDLSQYIDASSPEFARDMAAAYLLERYFSFPTKPYFDIEVKSAKLDKVLKVRLPLYYSGNTSRVRKKDISYYLDKKGFLKLKELRFKWSQKDMKFVKDTSLVVETFDSSLPKGAVELENWTSAQAGGSSIVQSALILKDAKAYAYLAVNSFSVSTVYYKGEEVSFLTALARNIKFFKDQGLDLILDIRNNGGGNGNYPSQLVSMLTQKDASHPNASWATPVTRYMRHLMDYYSVEDIFKDATGANWTRQADAFYEAVDLELPYSRAIQGDAITAHEGVKGYEGKIVALISPNCISACDITSIILKVSGRAQILGTNANGTGAGYRSNQDLNTQFKDRYNVFATNIPNMLFGYGKKDFDANNDLGLNSAYELNSENVPVKADIEYKETFEDTKNYMSGWITKAIEVLNQ